MAGWGSLFGKIADWFPGRRESIQNKITAIKEELYELQQETPSPASNTRYIALLKRLSELERREERAS